VLLIPFVKKAFKHEAIALERNEGKNFVFVSKGKRQVQMPISWSIDQAIINP